MYRDSHDRYPRMQPSPMQPRGLRQSRLSSYSSSPSPPHHRSSPRLSPRLSPRRTSRPSSPLTPPPPRPYVRPRPRPLRHSPPGSGPSPAPGPTRAYPRPDSDPIDHPHPHDGDADSPMHVAKRARRVLCEPSERTSPALDTDSRSDMSRPVRRRTSSLSPPGRRSGGAGGGGGGVTGLSVGSFFAAHRGDEWFLERYHPDDVRARTRRVAAECRYRATEFRRLWTRGAAATCAPRMSYGTRVPEAFAHPDDVWDDARVAQHHHAKTKARAQEHTQAHTHEDTERADCTPNSSMADLGAHPPEEREERDKENDNIDGEEVDDDVLPSRRRYRRDTLFLRKLPPDLGRESLTRVLQQGEDGDDDLPLVRVKLGEISAKSGPLRTAWAVYRDEATAERAHRVLQHASVACGRSGKRPGCETSSCGKREYKINCQINQERRHKLGGKRLLPYVFGTAARMRKDVKQSVQIMWHLDRMRDVPGELNPLTEAYLYDTVQEDGRRLDHVVSYLHDVHLYCYYNGVEFLEDIGRGHELSLRPTVNRVKQMGKEDVEGARRVDDKSEVMLRRDYDRPRSGASHAEWEKEEAVRDWVMRHAVKQDEGIFTCDLVDDGHGRDARFGSLASVRAFMEREFKDDFDDVVGRAVDAVFCDNFERDLGRRDVMGAFGAGYFKN